MTKENPENLEPTEIEYEAAKTVLTVQFEVGMLNELTRLSPDQQRVTLTNKWIDLAFGIHLLNGTPEEERLNYVHALVDTLRERAVDKLVISHQVEHVETALMRALRLPGHPTSPQQ